MATGTPRRTPRADRAMFQVGDCVDAEIQGRRLIGRVGGLHMMPGPFGRRRLFVDVLVPTPVRASQAAKHPAGYALIVYSVQARAVGAGLLRKIKCPNVDHPFYRGTIQAG